MSDFEALSWQSCRTTWGWLVIAGYHQRLCRTVLDVDLDRALQQLTSAAPVSLVEATWNSSLMNRLARVLEGAPDDFCDVDINVDSLSTVTPFRKKALMAARKVGLGTTCSYATLAKRIGHPRAARAVGSAMATNPVPLVIPCHRIVGSHGGLGGYTSHHGLALKKFLLETESALRDHLP